MSNSAGRDWEEVDYFLDDREQKAIIKRFSFANFAEALDFVNKIGELAEKENHHPDINMGWGYVQVWLTTHSKHAITEQDHKLAALTDKIYEERNPS